MTKLEWHSGPPPHVGWWRTDRSDDDDQFWRWWDGEQWSVMVWPEMNAEYAGFWAMQETQYTKVEWCDYWPENTRVQRIKP